MTDWRTWQAGGGIVSADDTGLFIRQAGAGPDLVCFHGFPTSSYDWHRLLPLLAGRFRVTVFDFPGYGLSDKPPSRDYSIFRQCDAAQALLETLEIRRAHLLAHDMGVTVACELLARLAAGASAPALDTVTLLNAGLYMDLHQPLITQRLLRMPRLGAVVGRFASRRLFMHQYPQVYAAPEAFDATHYESQWQLLIHNHGRRVLHRVAGYMRERVRHHPRWIGALQTCPLPLTLIWGMADRIAVPAIVKRAARELPAARIIRLPGIGHYPQLEAPAEVARAL